MKHYALLGRKLSHSYSKEIHEYIFRSLQIEADYSLWELEPEHIDEVISLAKEKKLSGFNITTPYKEKVFSQLEEIESCTKKIGAVNTIAISETIRGFNTDCLGFQKMLEFFQVNVSGKSAVILGTGGAAKAVAEALRQLKISSILFVSRNPKEKDQITYHDIPKADLIINTTPVGMYPNNEISPVPAEVFQKFKIAIDVIYNPMETKFLKEAKQQNLLTLNGLFMLVAQAIQAEEIWQNKLFDKAFYYEVYSYLEGKIYENNAHSRS